MESISILTINGTTYEIKDSVARGYDADGDGVVDTANGLTETAQNSLAQSIYTLLMEGEW